MLDALIVSTLAEWTLNFHRVRVGLQISKTVVFETIESGS